jgi:hypothetical protein
MIERHFMPVNEQSELRKEKILSLVKQRIGACYRNHANRRDWYSSKDGTVDVFITDSKAHFNKRPWFDMKDDDIQELANHEAGFVIFILGDDNDYIVVPARDLAAQRPNHIEGLLPTGFYHFNLVLRRPIFQQLPEWNLKPYFRKIELLPQQAGIVSPSHKTK